MGVSPAGWRKVFSAVSVLGLMSACSSGDQAAPAGAAPVEVQAIQVTETPVTMEAEIPGRLEAYRQAEVRARVAGIVTERVYQEGQEVKKGTPLFLINPELLSAAREDAAGALAQAEANHLNAVDKLERYKDLVSDQSVSQRDYKVAAAEELAARAAMLSAKAKLNRANLDLGYARVTAPIDGIARRALVTEGALVGQDSPTPLTTIDQIDPIYVNFSQPAADVMALQRSVRAGQVQGKKQGQVTVRLILPDGSEYTHKGKLYFSDLAVNSTTDSVAMRALFDNPARELFPGAYVQVKLDQAVNPHAILIPRDALIRTAQAAQVMTLDKDDKVVPVEVQTSGMQGREWIVVKGLKAGDRVVTTNVATLAPGAQVKVTPAAGQTP
jgi:membrane fusion protein, multidrug efflux system